MDSIGSSSGHVITFLAPFPSSPWAGEGLPSGSHSFNATLSLIDPPFTKIEPTSGSEPAASNAVQHGFVFIELSVTTFPL